MTTTLERPVVAPTPLTTDLDEFAVTVTLDDIRWGSRSSPIACAMARAAFRKLDPATQLCQMGSDGTLHIFTQGTNGGPPRIEIFVNRDAGEWVRCFDVRKDSVAPERFVFERHNPLTAA
jgi:hypothetical protein